MPEQGQNAFPQLIAGAMQGNGQNAFLKAMAQLKVFEAKRCPGIWNFSTSGLPEARVHHDPV